MAPHPFSDASASSKSFANRRRSTRVTADVPIILSGRDASGQPFRDETHTVLVSLHGALLQTSRQVLVGMQVTIEIPRTGIIEKAICMRAGDPVPAGAVHSIAVQLVKPRNIWGLENPPADWQVAPDGQPQSLAAAPPAADQSVAPTVLIAPQLAALEQQGTQVTDAALVRLRGLVEETLTAAFDDFQRQLDGAVTATQECFDKSAAALEQKAGETAEGVAERLRGPAEERLAAASEEFQRRLDAKLAAAEERFDKRAAALEQQAGEMVEGVLERSCGPAEQKLAAAAEDFQRWLDTKLATIEELLNKRAAALEQQAGATVEGTVERLRESVEEMLSAALDDFQPRLDAKLATAEERLEKRSAALEQQATQVNDAALRWRGLLDESLAAGSQDLQRHLDARLAAGEERLDKRATALEQQVGASLEGAGERLRGLIEKMLASASEEFQRRAEGVLAVAEQRMTRRSEESFAQLEEALAAFRRDLDDELNARIDQTLISAEQALRAKIPSVLASLFAPAAAVSSGANPEKK